MRELFPSGPVPTKDIHGSVTEYLSLLTYIRESCLNYLQLLWRLFRWQRELLLGTFKTLKLQNAKSKTWKWRGDSAKLQNTKTLGKKTVETHVKSKLKNFSLQRAENVIDNFYFGRQGPTHNRPPPPPPPPPPPLRSPRIFFLELKGRENAESAIWMQKAGNCGHLKTLFYAMHNFIGEIFIYILWACTEFYRVVHKGHHIWILPFFSRSPISNP